VSRGDCNDYVLSAREFDVCCGCGYYPPWVARRKSDRLCLGIVSKCRGGHFGFYLHAAGCRTNYVFATRHSQWKEGMVIAAPTNPSLAAGRTRCSHLEIVSQTQMSSWMRHYPSLVVQTGRITAVIQYAGSSMWGSRFILIVIAITHLLAFRALITPIIAPGLVPLSAISLEWVPRLLAPEFWWSLQLLQPWDLPLGFWSVRPLLPPDFLERLRVLLLDLVPFAILCVVCCCAGSRWVYRLCMYTESTARHCLLYCAFLSPVT